MTDTGSANLSDDNNIIDSEEQAEETFEMDVSFDVEIISDVSLQDGLASRDHYTATSSDDSSSTSSDSDSSDCYVTMETSPPSSYQSASLPLYYEGLKQPPGGADGDESDVQENISECTPFQKRRECESGIAQFIHEMLCKIQEDAMRQESACDGAKDVPDPDGGEESKPLIKSRKNEVAKNRGRCTRQKKKKIRQRAKQSQSSKSDASTKLSIGKEGKDIVHFVSSK